MEVDFVAREGINVRQLIQVTYTADRIGIEKREINTLVKSRNEMECNKLLVITWEYEGV